MTILLNFALIAILPVDVVIYRFEENCIEIWYQIPVRYIVSSIDEIMSPKKDTIFKSFDYKIEVYDIIKNESTYFGGTKGAFINIKQQEDYFIDYIPVYLYPGKFSYRFTISSLGEKSQFEGEIDMSNDTLILTSSDIIIGKKSRDSNFKYRGYSFIPTLDRIFLTSDILFSYIELYNLIPDSLYYKIQYRIINSFGKVILENNLQRQKYNYTQSDTFATELTDFIEGTYTLSIYFYDPSSNLSVSRSKDFVIKSLLDETTEMKFYRDIQYLVSNEEYRRFSLLPEDDKKIYLKKFWAKRDYRQFEKRLLEADAKFTTPFKRGRDTGQGRVYIQMGPPDLIEYREDLSDPKQSKPRQIWHYDSRGIQILFCDSNKDDDLEFLKTLKARDEWDDHMEEREEIKGYIY